MSPQISLNLTISLKVKQRLSSTLETQIIAQILSYFRKGCLGLALGATLAIVFLPAQHAYARETYMQLATRLLAQPPAGAEIRADLEVMILRATNAYRVAQGLPLLKAGNSKLTFGARAQAMDLLAQKTMGHSSSGGHGFESRVRALHQGQMVFAPMAENAARLRNRQLGDREKAQALVTQWLKSAGHRKNIVNRTYTTVAIGVAVQGDDIYAVQIFSGPVAKTNMWGGQAQPQ